MNLYLLGSIAFDELYHFDGHFNEVLSGTDLEKLSVCFVTQSKEVSHGGCSGNLAYGLSLLGVDANIIGAVGEQDSERYLTRLYAQKMNLKYVEKRKGSTAKATILTDNGGRQIAHFHPGVSADELIFPSIDFEIDDILFVSPENYQRMKDAVIYGSQTGAEVFFDPGQMTHVFSKEDYLELLPNINVLLVNEYEWDLIQKTTEMSAEELRELVAVVIVTLGSKGAILFQNDEKFMVNAHEIDAEVNPTGAGEAFRSGLLASLKKGLSLIDAMNVAVLMGAACAATKTTQDYSLPREIRAKLKQLGF